MDARIATSSAALWFAVTLPLLVLYLATLRTNPLDMSVDVISVTPSAWHVAHDGTPRVLVGSPHYDAWMIPSGSGHLVSNREPGLVGLAAIFYWLLPFTSEFDVTPASLAAAVVTSAAMGTLALVFRRLASARTALVSALVAGTATTTWAVSGTALWPHGPDQLYLALGMLALASGRWLLAGLAFAFAIVTRPPLGVVAAVTGAWIGIRERSVRLLAEIGVASALGLVAFLLYSHRFWGGGLQSQYERAAAQGHAGDGDFVGALADVHPHALLGFLENIAGTLISPGRGILIGAPFLVVLALGLPTAWRVAPSWVRSSAVAGVAYLAVQLKANRFGGGSLFWSYRYPLEPLTLAAPLLVLAWATHTSKTPRRRGACFALVVLAIALQATGALCFREQRTNWWLPADLASAVKDRPMLAAPILFIGYVSGAVIYRRLSDPDGERSQSVFARFRRSEEPSDTIGS